MAIGHQLYIVICYFIGTLLHFARIYFHRYHQATCLDSDLSTSFSFPGERRENHRFGRTSVLGVILFWFNISDSEASDTTGERTSSGCF